MSNEYVIVWTMGGDELRFYTGVVRHAWVGDICAAQRFPTVGSAVGCLTSPDFRYGGKTDVTIHRVVREPAHVEEVPLKDALNEGLPLVVHLYRGKEREYVATEWASAVDDERQAGRFRDADGAIECVRQIAQRFPNHICRIVGVCEAPGRMTTVEVG